MLAHHCDVDLSILFTIIFIFYPLILSSPISSTLCNLRLSFSPCPLFLPSFRPLSLSSTIIHPLSRDPFVIVKEHSSEEDMVASAAERMSNGEVLAWFQGKSGAVRSCTVLHGIGSVWIALHCTLVRWLQCKSDQIRSDLREIREGN